MTEYKQLTANGAQHQWHFICSLSRRRHLPSVMAGSPDGMFTAGPISESDFFIWEALICGPKDTPFVRINYPFLLYDTAVFAEYTARKEGCS